MNKQEFYNLRLGLYKIFWKSGGHSVAAVGNSRSGVRWIAPCNWVMPSLVTEGILEEIARVELVKVRFGRRRASVAKLAARASLRS